jgi:hypothetical protein
MSRFIVGVRHVCLVLVLVLVPYLMMLSISIPYSINDRIINEYVAAEGMRIGRGNQSTQRKPARNDTQQDA